MAKYTVGQTVYCDFVGRVIKCEEVSTEFNKTTKRFDREVVYDIDTPHGKIYNVPEKMMIQAEMERIETRR